MNEVIGFIPAAGVGSRMKGFLTMKEMLPVPSALTEKKQIKFLIDDAIRCFINNGIFEIVFVVNDKKGELIDYIKNEYAYTKKIDAKFVYQAIDSDHYGVPYAIESASELLKNRTVVMRFPDTLLLGDVDLTKLIDFHKSMNSVLTLGVFHTEHPERLGPVSVSDGGEIIKIEDKPRNPAKFNTWNCVVWGNTFANEIINTVQAMKHKSNKSEIMIADVMQKFIGNGAYAVEDEGVNCVDISCIEDLDELYKSFS